MSKKKKKIGLSNTIIFVETFSFSNTLLVWGGYNLMRH